MPGRVFNLLAEIAADQHGLITPDDARGAGIDPRRLVEMERRGTLERVRRGIYRVPLVADETTALEHLATATKWARGKGVLCHDTALDLHELCDINPSRIHITIPTTLHLYKETPRLYAVHQRDLGPNETTLYEGIPIVTARRAILDGVEGNVRADLLEQAIETALRRGLVKPAAIADLRRRLKARGRGIE